MVEINTKILGSKVAEGGYRWMVLAPALLVILLSSISLIDAIGNNNFWADDFGNIAAFNQSLGSFNDLSVNSGRFILNLFFFMMGTSFGVGSSFPYLISASLISGTGIFLILYESVKMKLVSRSMTIFILACLMGSVTLWPVFLWATNVTHGASLLCFGLAFYNFRKNWEVDFKSYRKHFAETAWLSMIILCNPLYIGVILIFAIYSMYIKSHLIGRTARLSQKNQVISMLIGVMFPLVYFLAVSQPVQSKNISYASTSIQNILPNLDFYFGNFFDIPLVAQILVYICMLLIIGFPGYKSHELILLMASLSILVPVLIQSQVRVLNYLIFPIIFLGLLCSRIFDRILESNSAKRYLVYFILISLPLFTFYETRFTRSWYQVPGLGSETNQLLEEIHASIPTQSDLCVKFDLSPEDENYLVGGFSGTKAFSLSPTYARKTYIDSYNNCVSDKTLRQIVIFKSKDGKFQAQVDELTP